MARLQVRVRGAFAPVSLYVPALLEMRQELGGHEKNEDWEDKFNELLQLLNRLDTHLSRE